MSEMSEVKPSGVEKFLTYAIVAASSGVMLYICYRSFIMLGFWALLKTLGVTFIAIGLLKPVLWASKWFRDFIKPDIYFTHGVRDAFDKRIFWMVGPQFGAVSIYTLFAVMFISGAAGILEKEKSSSPVVEVAKRVDVDRTTDANSRIAAPESNQNSQPSVVPVPAAPETVLPQASEPVPAGNQSTTKFELIAPVVAQKVLSEMLNNAQSAFKLSQLKAEVEALPKPQQGDRKTARKLNDAGLQLLKEENYDAALESLNKATTVDEADVEIKNNLVYALIKAKKYEQAEIKCGELLAVAPGRSSAWANLAEIYAGTSRDAAASEALIVAFQFSSNKDRTLTFLMEHIADISNPLNAAAKSALTKIEKL